MTKKLRGLTAAALAATALFAAQPAAADIIELDSWWAGHSTDHISYAGLPFNVNANEQVGGFKTINHTTGSTFQSFCVDIFDSFSFGATSNSTEVPAATIVSAQAAADLGLLYTEHHAAIDSNSSTGANEAAFQLAVWEIVNEGGSGAYDLSSGKFTASGNDVSLAQEWLNGLLGSDTPPSKYTARFWTVDSMRTTALGHAQDVVVFAPVPEPQTYAMMLVGLGLLGFSARRKSQNLS